LVAANTGRSLHARLNATRGIAVGCRHLQMMGPSDCGCPRPYHVEEITTSFHGLKLHFYTTFVLLTKILYSHAGRLEGCYVEPEALER